MENFPVIKTILGMLLAFGTFLPMMTPLGKAHATSFTCTGANCSTISTGIFYSVNPDNPNMLSASFPKAGNLNFSAASDFLRSGNSVSTTGSTSSGAAAPTVSEIYPSSGPADGGTTVTISGTNLSGATAVTLGGKSATITGNSVTSITAVTQPHGAGSVNVVVTTAGGSATLTSGFTYAAAPTVISVSPNVVFFDNTRVVINGTGLTGATAVSFGGTLAKSFTVNSATQITANTPSVAPGTVNVLVKTPWGTSAPDKGNQITFNGAPSVTALSPSVGPTAGGTTVTITGRSLTGATAVTFGGTLATGFTVNSATQITATSPAGVARTVNVLVTTPSDTSAVGGENQFTYSPPLSPAACRSITSAC